MMGAERLLGRGPRRDAGKERRWRRHVARQVKSKQSVRAYCAAVGISEPSFYAWRRELAKRDAAAVVPPAHDERTARRAPSLAALPPRFLPVTIAPPASQAIEVLLPSGLVLRVEAHDAAALAAVLDLLEGRTC